MANSNKPKIDRTTLLGILTEQSDDVLREFMGTLAQAAIDAPFQKFIGAEYYERNDRRNGFRDRAKGTSSRLSSNTANAVNACSSRRCRGCSSLA